MSATAIATFTTRDEDDEITNGPAKWAAIRAKYSQDRIDRARKLYQPWYQFGQGMPPRMKPGWLNWKRMKRRAQYRLSEITSHPRSLFRKLPMVTPFLAG
jgi:hypothetical protein